MARAEDIREKISDLRARIPAAEPIPEEPKRPLDIRLIVGSIVFLVIIGAVASGITYFGYIKPKREKLKEAQIEKLKEIQEAFKGIESSTIRSELIKKVRDARTAEEVKGIDVRGPASFEKLRFEKLNLVESSYKGPLAYHPDKRRLISEINNAKDISDLKAIDVEGSALKAWRTYLEGLIEESVNEKGKVEIFEKEIPSVVDKERALAIVRDATLEQLMEITVKYPEPDATLGFPIVLDRVNAASGILSVGDYVDVFVRGESIENTSLVTRQARILAIFQERTRGQISLSESEKKYDTGGGYESKGVVTSSSISTAGASGASLTALPWQDYIGTGSAGLKSRARSTTYTVDLIEIIKAASANKVSESYVRHMLSDYGIRLTDLEYTSQLGDFDAKYMILVEIPKETIPVVLQANEPKPGQITSHKIYLCPIPDQTKILE